MSGQTALGPVGRVGRYTATHFRQVLAAWVLVALVLGFFAPRVEKALSERVAVVGQKDAAHEREDAALPTRIGA